MGKLKVALEVATLESLAKTFAKGLVHSSCFRAFVAKQAASEAKWMPSYVCRTVESVEKVDWVEQTA